MVVITTGYAAVFGLLFTALSARVIRMRWRYRVSLGHGGEKALEKALRAHGNFSEYVPLTLLIVALVELQQTNGLWVHGLCATLLTGRLLHAIGVSRRGASKLRVVGMVLTFTALNGAAITALVSLL